MNWYLILASCSPRRRELINYLGLKHECVSVDADESYNSTKPYDIACEISEKKAEACLEKMGIRDGQVIIGSDTTVVLGSKIYGKPKNREDGFSMLYELSGKAHSVYTGVTFIYKKDGVISKRVFAEETKVRFSDISIDEINDYLDVGEYKDKAGSYAIQGIFSKYIMGIDGDYNNVVGFPVSRIFDELKKI